MALIISGIRYLNFVGGKCATADVMADLANRVHAGEFPESPHAAGSA